MKKFSPFNQAMAGLRTRYSFCRNPPPGGEDELVEGLPGAPNKGSNTLIPFPLISQIQTSA